MGNQLEGMSAAARGVTVATRQWRLGTMAVGATLWIAPLQHGAVASDDCIRIENDLDRLACYDATSGRTPKATPVVSGDGAWEIREETSKLTDQKTVVMTTSTGGPVSCGRYTSAPVTLIVRCHENKTAIYFSTQCHMTSSDYSNYGKVDIRLDNDEAFVMDMDASTDSRALGLWAGVWSIPLIKKMFGKQKLVARMTPFSESPVIVEMNIAGLESQITPLREACSW